MFDKVFFSKSIYYIYSLFLFDVVFYLLYFRYYF